MAQKSVKNLREKGQPKDPFNEQRKHTAALAALAPQTKALALGAADLIAGGLGWLHNKWRPATGLLSFF